ncbi:hypothetical protein C8R44DRAFT_941353 [Mycena epipterygia]|nr:hypothetical protein C8R44DRAFT_941353 [Mycena epipterygia]
MILRHKHVFDWATGDAPKCAQAGNPRAPESLFLPAYHHLASQLYSFGNVLPEARTCNPRLPNKSFRRSLLATVLGLFISDSHPDSGPPPIEIRDTAVTAPHFSPKYLRGKGLSGSPPSERRESLESLLVRSEEVTAAPEVGVTLSPLKWRDAPPTHAVHFEPPLQTISTTISTAQNRLSHQSHGSRTSTDSNTLSFTSTEVSADTEHRGRRRSGLSKLVHLFTDRREKPTPVPASARSSPVRCPSLKHKKTQLHTRTCHSLRREYPSLAHHVAIISRVSSHPVLRQNSGPEQACTKRTTAETNLKKEPAVRPRTHPYEAPYFIPQPDSVDVVEPLARHRLRRRRTMPPLERPGSVV